MQKKKKDASQKIGRGVGKEETRSNSADVYTAAGPPLRSLTTGRENSP